MVRSPCTLGGLVACLALLAALPAQWACGYDTVRGRFVECGTSLRVGDGVADWQTLYLSGTGGPPFSVFDPVGNRMLAVHSSVVREWQHGLWRDLPNHRVGLFSTQRTWDVARNRLVVASGAIWEWDDRGVYGPFVGTIPPNRTCHGIAFDPATRRTLLLLSAAPGLLETWTWDGATTTLVATGPSPAGPRFLIGDPVRGRLVAVAGSETWEWDGVAWLQRANGGIGSSMRSAAFDPVRNQVLVFGRVGGGIGTLAWNGMNWTAIASPFEPPVDPYQPAAYDEARDELMVFGGRTNQLLDQTWVWNGFAWTERRPVVRPPARRDHAMAWHASSQRVVLFGGRDNSSTLLGDTWLWDGVNWSATAGSGPSARADAAFSPMGPIAPCLLFGGLGPTQELGDTWEWAGAGWAQRTPGVSPPARRSAGLAHDPLRSRTVLAFGLTGTTPRDDVFEWDGTDWNAAGRSPAFAGESLVFHPRLRGVLSAGIDPSIWDGANWLRTGNFAWRWPHPVLDTRRGSPVAVVSAQPRYFDNWYGYPAIRDGCGGRNGVPGLTASGQFGIGDARFRIELTTRVTGAPTVMALGLSATPRSLGNGCTWYPDQPTTAFFLPADARGNADWPVPIAAASGLVGTTLFLQGVILDANSPLGFSLSNVLEATIGCGP
ncbi:MAG: hypothetical protein IPK26_14500 [Planctomycetes bacterium]|nr:hypothetical protein [Planctomycetota bacterium]